MSETVKGLRAEIVKSPRGDYSNGGVSSRFDEVTLVGPEFTGPFEPTESAPPLRLVKRVLGSGRVLFHFEPLAKPLGAVGPMFGGAYVASSDSRFTEAVEGMYGAVPLHDRFETPAQYESLSR